MSYTETFISVADDCPAKAGECPPAKSEKLSKAALEYQLLSAQPYFWTHETLNYAAHRRQKEQTGQSAQTEELFFQKGHPCLRTSALTKRYGWGAHYDQDGRIALYAVDSPDYIRLSSPGSGCRQLKAMRSSKAKS